jgi:hypothetical protein
MREAGPVNVVIEASYWKRAGEVPMSAVHTVILQDNNDDTEYEHAYELQANRHVLVNCHYYLQHS